MKGSEKVHLGPVQDGDYTTVRVLIQELPTVASPLRFPGGAFHRGDTFVGQEMIGLQLFGIPALFRQVRRGPPQASDTFRGRQVTPARPPPKKRG